jgi:Concanavalin A-like lectin/glucanases superfamily/Secretion system C-terminal sorting domain
MKSLLFISLILVSNFFANAQNLVASYPFNGNADDATGNPANNGTVNGATLTTDRFGNNNSAYFFNGNTDYIGGSSSSFPTGDRTISLWFYAEPSSILANTPATFTYGGGGCGSSFLMLLNNVNNGKYQISGHCNSNLNEHAYITAPEATWYNWVATISGTTIKSYINGILMNTTTNFTTPTSTDSKDFYIGTLINNTGIGRFNPSGGYYFNGKIDDVKIFDGPLTDKQVADNFVAESLVASYPFNGAANDATGHGNNGTVNGATLTTDRFGNANSAYYFDGIDDYIEANADNLPTGNSTISLWFKADVGSIAAKPGLLGYGGNAGACPGNSLLMSIFNNTFTSQAHCASNLAQYISLSTPENNWYNWIVTTNGSTIKMYLNGRLVSTATTNTQPKIVAGKKLNMGVAVSSAGASDYIDGNIGRFKGVLDDVKIYDVPLSDSQVFDNYIKDQTKPGSGNGLQLNRTGTRATDPWVNIGSGYDFGAEPFTYETWVKRDDLHTTENNYAVALIVSESNGGWAIGINNNNTLFFSKASINSSNSTGTISDTKWHHVAVAYTGSELKFYIDGVSAGINSYTDSFTSNGNYTIGARQSFGNANGDQTLNGMIDETRIWKNVVLSETEIRDWMCKKITSNHPQYAKLFAYFNFDENPIALPSARKSSVVTSPSIRGFGGHFGELVNNPIIQTSGAALGDQSVYAYSIGSAGGKTGAKSAGSLLAPLILYHTTGENITVNSTTGNPNGIQVYHVNEAPNFTTGLNQTNPFAHYFGVFQVGGTSPTYTATYNYFGQNVPTAETNLRLFSRTNNAVTTWTEYPALPNTSNQTITLTGQNTEYILAGGLTTLPLNLLSFSGKNENSQNILNWLTSNEVALSHFEIERSSPIAPEGGIATQKFEKIGEVKANGGPSEKVMYEFTDLQHSSFNIHNSSLLYRLKMVDLDGKFKYSNIINIQIKQQLELSIYPNPTTDYFSISGNTAFEKLQIVDMAGRLVKEFLPQNDNNYSLNGLNEGIYFVKIFGGNQLKYSKIIKK